MNKFKGNKSKNKKYEFKYIALKAREPCEKEVNGKKYYYCTKPHGPDGILMWTLHKSSEHKDFKLKKPKEEKVDIELQDNL